MARTIFEKCHEVSIEVLWNMLKLGITEGVVKFVPNRRSKIKDSLPWLSLGIKCKSEGKIRPKSLPRNMAAWKLSYAFAG